MRIGSFSRAIDYAPYHVAKSKGWFDALAKKHGTTVEYTEFQSLAPINEALATDRIDFVFEAESPVIIGRAAGIDIRIMGLGASLVQEVLVRKNSGIDKIEDLKGRKVAVLAGTSSHFGLLKIASQHDLKRNDFQIVDMAPADAKAAFELAHVDGWAVWPPWVEQEVVAERGLTLQGGNASIQSVVGVRGKFADANPAITNEVLAIVDRAKRWIVGNKGAAQEILADELDLSLEVVREAWPKHDFAAHIGLREIEDIQEKADFLFELRLVKRRVVAAEFVSPAQ
jgi:sulfonate transport system substrate-binding protein